MPSLHTAWATTLFVHTREGSRLMRFVGAFWLVATLTATLGFGYHYGADLVAGVVFALTVEAGMRGLSRGWDRSATLLVVHGTVVFAALLAAYRYLPTRLAEHAWLGGPLLLLAMASVVHHYVRTAGVWKETPPTGRIAGPGTPGAADAPQGAEPRLPGPRSGEPQTEPA
jgi:hypothetical protein